MKSSSKLKLILGAALAMSAALMPPVPFVSENPRVKRSKDTLPGYIPEINRDFTRSSSKRWKGSRKSGGRK